MITCLFCQRTFSSCANVNTALPNWARNHLRDCAPCREYYEATTTLARQLSASAGQQRRSPSPFLHGKIMSTIRSQQNAESQPASGRWSLALGVGTVCLVVAACIVWLQSPASDQNVAKSISAPAEIRLNVNLPSAAQVNQWTKNLDAPLEEEMNLVLSDANGALNTLARSFLPEDFLSSSKTTGH